MGYNITVKWIVFLLFIQSSLASDAKRSELYVKVFSSFSKTKTHKIADNISEFKTNVKLLVALDKGGKRLGFIREVTTSTGCNDGCLPVIFTLFYDAKGKYLKLLSRPGLTKKDHEEFNELDYIRLETILRKNPGIFKMVAHPTEMVDGITRATLTQYQPHVIAKAAYTTLRTNLYNQETLKHIQKTFISPSKN